MKIQDYLELPLIGILGMKEKYSPGKEHDMEGLITKAMTQFFISNPPGEFQPCAYFDKHLDCIRVQLKDCSFTEIRLNKTFTIYQDNHSNGVEYIGFSIKGVRHLFERLGTAKAKENPVILAQIIDEIIKEDPDAFSDLIQREFYDKFDLEVEDFEEAA